MRIVLTCGDAAATRVGSPGRGTEVVAAGDVPARAELDPLVARAERLVVAGSDAALAAVLVRLLRAERLAVTLALVPAPDSVAAGVWGVPTVPSDAVALALDGPARQAVLVRDDRGGVVVGAHHLGAFDGEVYADEHLVARGGASGMVVRPDPLRHGVAVTVTGRPRWGGLRAGVDRAGHGRAVQVGCRPAAAERDGVPDERPVQRRSWYRHVEDWRLVRP